MQEKKALTREISKRYQKAEKKEKTDILDELVKTTGYNRKYILHVVQVRENICPHANSILFLLDIYLDSGNNTTMTAANFDSALIRKTELFSSLSQNEIDYVISRSGTLNLRKGAFLFSSGEKAKHFYILKEGTVRVFKPNDSGGDEMALYNSGDTIGDFDFARGAEYDACAEAAEDSQLIMFPDSGLTMDSLALEEPHAVCSILLNAIVLMTGRIKSINRLILKNMSWVQELHRRAYEDPGTGLWKQTLIADEITGVLNDPTALIMLKPDRFKTLVDSRGHGAGDEAMIRIAAILKNAVRKVRQGWPLRFKSNEVGVIINNSEVSQAKEIAEELAAAVNAMEPVPAYGDIPAFPFSATVVWSLWSMDDAEWESLFNGNYAALLENWRDGGDKIVHYSKTAEP
jgi:diguanylate cyclase (GGDEF)-like protein